MLKIFIKKIYFIEKSKVKIGTAHNNITTQSITAVKFLNLFGLLIFKQVMALRCRELWRMPLFFVFYICRVACVFKWRILSRKKRIR